MLEKRLVEIECDSWKDNVINKPKLRAYVKYVEINLSRSERSYLAQFKCGMLPIRIVTGRFRGENVNERMCTFCNQNDVEDEIHFMFRCQKFHELREHLFHYVKQNTKFLSISIIMNNLKYLCQIFQGKQLNLLRIP